MEKLIEGRNLTKTYISYNRKTLSKKQTHAVDHLDITVEKGMSLGLIGESGCGKSTLAKLLLSLERPDEGSVSYKGKDISGLSYSRMRPYRKEIQMIFQNSVSVFDPNFTIGNSFLESLNNFREEGSADPKETAVRMIERVGLGKEFLSRFPGEVSGGERQRCNIARAFLTNPEFVICDEPVSSLDYSLRRQILDLLNDIRKETGTAYLYITHDLSTLKYVCDYAQVMYAGKIVERFRMEEGYEEKLAHPYTIALFDSVPDIRGYVPKRKRIILKNDIYSDERSGKGCIFKGRCPFRETICEEAPPMVRIAKDHYVACHRKEMEPKADCFRAEFK